MVSARTAFALAALAVLATIGHAAALPIDLSASAVDLSAPAAAPQGDGLVPDTGAQRARREGWGEWLWNGAVSTVQTVATVAVCVTPGTELVLDACATVKTPGGVQLAVNEAGKLVDDTHAPIYGYQCGADDIANNKHKDELDSACLFHDVCTSTNYGDRDDYFQATFPGAIDWGSKTGSNTGNCKCETEAHRRAVAARNPYYWWTFSSWRFTSARPGVVAFFRLNMGTNCEDGELASALAIATAATCRGRC